MIVLFSGPIAVGKSTVSSILENQHGYERIRTSRYLKSLLLSSHKQPSRTELQNCGDDLDIKTDYNWVIDDVFLPALSQSPSQQKWLFDSVRKPQQISNFKQKFGAQVIHFHLTASEALLIQRYTDHESNSNNEVSYMTATSHENEVISRSLIALADYVIEVDKLTSEEIVKEIIKKLAKEDICVKWC